MDLMQMRDMGLEHLTYSDPEQLKGMSIKQLRGFLGIQDDGYWDSDHEEESIDRDTLCLQDHAVDVAARALGDKFRDKVDLRRLLCAGRSPRRALGERLKAFVCTFMDASTVALSAANNILNLHLFSNGRMLFEVNEENLARLLAFLFHKTRDPDDVLFRGIPDHAVFAPERAGIPPWMRTGSIERRLASKMKAAIDRSIDDVSNMVFEFAADRRLEATGLARRSLPPSDEVWNEAVTRLELAESGSRGGFPVPAWSVSPHPKLAPVLDDLYDLLPRLLTGSLEDRLIAINETNGKAKDEVREGVKSASARARSLRAAARRSRRNRAAIKLAEAAERHARKVAAQEQASADIVLPFRISPLSAPSVVLDCETMRDILLSLDVQVPSLEECRADELGLFSRVFRMPEFLAEAGTRRVGRVRFAGIIDTDGEEASVHCIFEGPDATRRVEQSEGGSTAEAPLPGAGAGAGDGKRSGKKRRGKKRY